MRGLTAGDRRVPSATAVAVGVVLFASAGLLPLLRQRGAHSWDTIWAEDGSIYFQQVHDHGFLGVVARSYAGYLQLPPRLLAGIAAAMPIRSLAWVFALLDVIVAALLAFFVYWATDGWIESRPVRLA